MEQLQRHLRNHIITRGGSNLNASGEAGELRFTDSWNNVESGPSREEVVMKLRIAALFLMLAVAGSVAFAHGDKKHVSGIVEKITADSVLVKTADGKSVEVKLVSSTVYVLHVVNSSAAGTNGTGARANQDKPAKLSDLAVGDRVLIHATPKGETLEAAEVRFSAPGAASATANKPKS
jgi:hypothetical protein